MAGTKLTAKLADDICTRLRSGSPRVESAESLRIHRDSLHKWLQLGTEARVCTIANCADEHHGPVNAAATTGEPTVSFADFADMVMQAEAEAVVLNVGYVQKAAQHEPQNARWWLERRSPSFKTIERREISGIAGAPIEVQLTARERLRSSVERIAKRLDERIVPPTAIAESGEPAKET